MLSGVLNVNKPSGATSRRVVDAVQRLVRPAKAGHAGTLDPLASGVLVVCVGQATRLIEYVQRMPKRYRGTFLLGRTSPTEDVEGEVTLLAEAPAPPAAELAAAAERLVGWIDQRPPVYSALKVAGRRAYDMARAGERVELEARRVRIDRLDILRYEYPELDLEVECGGGTYIRSLGRDLARSLRTDAVMSALVRKAIGGFHLEDACSIDDLSRENIVQRLLPPAAAVGGLPAIRLAPDEVARLAHGQRIAGQLPPGAEEAAGFDVNGRLAAILVARDGCLSPARNFCNE